MMKLSKKRSLLDGKSSRKKYLTLTMGETSFLSRFVSLQKSIISALKRPFIVLHTERLTMMITGS